MYRKYQLDGLIELLQNLPEAAAAGLQTTELGKEYVWGPGDGGVARPQNGADELIAIFDQGWLDKSGDPSYAWDQPW